MPVGQSLTQRMTQYGLLAKKANQANAITGRPGYQVMFIKEKTGGRKSEKQKGF